MSRLVAIALCLWPVMVSGELELVADETAQAVFSGRPQKIRVLFHNPGHKTAVAELSTRIFQASTGSLMPVGEAQPWKRLEVLPGQTVVEVVPLTFPTVRAATPFQVHWAGIGHTEVMVYPDDLLKRLNTLAGDAPVGVYDPNNQIRPMLKLAHVEFTDFEIETRDCRLAVVWSDANELPESILSRVKKGMAVVWVRPQKLPAYAVRVEAGTVVLVPVSNLASLSESPQPQLNLLRFAELALRPDALRLPSNNEPQ